MGKVINLEYKNLKSQNVNLISNLVGVCGWGGWGEWGGDFGGHDCKDCYVVMQGSQTRGPRTSGKMKIF